MTNNYSDSNSQQSTNQPDENIATAKPAVPSPVPPANGPGGSQSLTDTTSILPGNPSRAKDTAKRQKIDERYQYIQWPRRSNHWPTLPYRWDAGFQTMCRCYQSGLTTPPPVDPEFISVEGGYPHLLLPLEGYEPHHERFLDWMQCPCEHPNMIYAEAGSGCTNVTELFYTNCFVTEHALQQIGRTQFPLLDALLFSRHTPHRSVPFGSIGKLLSEIDCYCRHAERITFPSLVEEGSGKTVYSFLESVDLQNLECWDALPCTALLDDDGFYLRENGMPQGEIFRSQFFEEKVVKRIQGDIADAEANNVLVQYRDLLTDKQVTCMVPNESLSPTGAVGSTRQLRLRHQVEESALGHIYSFVDPLAKVCRAAIEVGKPVHIWT